MNSKDAQRPDQKWHAWSISVQETKVPDVCAKSYQCFDKPTLKNLI